MASLPKADPTQMKLFWLLYMRRFAHNRRPNTPLNTELGHKVLIQITMRGVHALISTVKKSEQRKV